MAKNNQMRFERVNPCKECRKRSAHCDTAHQCDIVRQPLRDYSGIRFTADGFDCALPVTIDSHSYCSFGCSYCFSNTIFGHHTTVTKMGAARPGQTSLKKIESIFSGKGGKDAALFRMGLKYHDRNKEGYPCPVQLGGLCDPLDNIERNQGWFLKFVDIAIKYEQPVRISTKGNLFLEEEYLRKMEERPDLFWVAFSTISPDDKILALIEPGTPSATERIQCMANLSSIGVKCSLRFRPLIPGVSDATPDYPEAYKTLIEDAARAGACAISTEVAFVPGAMTRSAREKWAKIEKITNIPLTAIYKSFGSTQSCTRPSYLWTEGIMHAVVDSAHKNRLTVGISDPVWKQLGDTGCCCGILPDDKVFGNWQRASATNRLLEAKHYGREISLEDITPEWSHHVPDDKLVCYNAGPDALFARRHSTWADRLRSIWNDVGKERSPANYFQGAIVPVRVDENKNVVYRYQGLTRAHKPAPYWTVR
jgi:DNA repair photolyase